MADPTNFIWDLEMKDKSFNFIFDESLRHSQVFKRYLHYTQPSQPSGTTLTKLVVLMWAIIQVDFLNSASIPIITENKFLSLFRNAFMKVNLHLASISNEISIICILGFGYFLAWILHSFYIVCTTKNLHLTFRRSVGVKTLKALNGLTLLGLTNIIWVAYWFQTYTESTVVEGKNARSEFDSVVSWILGVLGIFYTIYSLFLFHWITPFFPSRGLKTFKQTYSSDQLRFIMIIILVFFTKFKNLSVEMASIILLIILAGHCWIIYDVIRFNYLEERMETFVLFVEILLGTYIFTLTFDYYGSRLINYEPNLGVCVAGLSSILFLKLRKVSIPYFKMKDINDNKELSQKDQLLKIFLDFNFRLNRPFSTNNIAVTPHMTVATYPINSLSTIISHKQDCNQLSCACHDIDLAQSKNPPTASSTSENHLINVFLSKSIESYIAANPFDNEMILWYLKFIFSYFKNYPFMLCHMKAINRIQLHNFQSLQLYSMEEEIIYRWRYKVLDSIREDPIIAGIFKYVDFVMAFNRVKAKACDLLRNYLALIDLLQNQKLTIEAIDKANKRYNQSKKEYLEFVSKIKLATPFLRFHNDLCKLCIPELKRQERFRQFKDTDLDKSKIIYSDKSSYLFLSLDNSSRGIILNTNKNIEKVVGYTANNLIGRLVNKMIPGDIAIHHDQFLRNYIATGKGIFVDKVQELFLIHKNGFIIPVTIFVKNFLSSGNSSPCMLTFFKMKEDKRDLMFVSPEGKVLNMTERFEHVTKWKASLGLQDAFIQTLLPKIRPIFKTLLQSGSIESIKTEIEKIKGADGMCQGILYVNRALANCIMPSKNYSELSSFIDINNIKITRVAEDVRETINFGPQKSQPKSSSFKVRFEIEPFQTDIGTFFTFAFSSISPHTSRIAENIQNSHLNLHRITLLKLFVQNLIKAKHQRVLLDMMSDKKVERNLLLMHTQTGKPLASPPSKPKVKAEVKALEELNVSKITEKKMFGFNLLLIFKILASFAVYLILTVTLYSISLTTFNSLQGSFDIAEKRNFVYNFISVIGLLNYHQKLPTGVTFSKANNSTDYTFLPTSRNYTNAYLTGLLNSNVAFAKIQKEFFFKKLQTMPSISMEDKVTRQVLSANNFSPLLPLATMNATSNLYDMFVFFNFHMNKNKISFAKYSNFGINAYRLTEEYGLDNERSQFLATIKSQMSVIVIIMMATVGAILVVYAALGLIVVRFLSEVAYFYSLTALISFSKNKIKNIKAFIRSNDLVFDFHRFNIKSLKSSNTKKRNFKLYKSLLAKVLILMGGFFLITSVMLIAEVIGLTGFLKDAVMETESVINNILNIDFLVAKALIGLQDSSYPRRTHVRIFFRKFTSFFTGGFEDQNTFVSSVSHIGIDEDLCPLIADPLNFTDCEKILDGIFTKGYKQLSSIVRHEVTEAYTNKLTFYKITNFETLGQVLMGFLYATQIMGESFKLGVEESVNTFAKSLLALILISFAIQVFFAFLVWCKVRKTLEETMTTSLLLLLHIKPRIMLINSKLLRIFK